MLTEDAGGWPVGIGLILEFWGPARYGDVGILLRKPSRLRG